MDPTETLIEVEAVQTAAKTAEAAELEGVELDEHEQKEADEQKHKRESSIQKLKRQREEARRETEYWKQEAMKPKAADTERPAVVQPEGKPKPDQFETVGDYFEALADWKAETKLAERDRKTEEASTRTRQAEHAKTWGNREAEARTRYSDYDEALAEDVRISRSMHDMILESDVGPDVAYWLGKNPVEAQRIASLSPTAAAREIGKIEARVAPPDKPAVVVRSASSAPAPISPVSKAAKTEADPDKMSADEWAAMRNKQLQARRRRP